MRSLYIVLLALTLAVAAQAAPYEVGYTVTGTLSTLNSGTSPTPLGATGDTFQFTFSLPIQPTPDNFSVGSFFEFFTVPTTYTFGSTVVTGDADITFWNAPNGLLNIVLPENSSPDVINALLTLTGPVLFNGTEDAPTLVLGKYPAGGAGDLSVNDTVTFDLLADWTVTNGEVDTNPEPATWAFMLGAALLLAPKLRALRKRT